MRKNEFTPELTPKPKIYFIQQRISDRLQSAHHSLAWWSIFVENWSLPMSSSAASGLEEGRTSVGRTQTPSCRSWPASWRGCATVGLCGPVEKNLGSDWAERKQCISKVSARTVEHFLLKMPTRKAGKNGSWRDIFKKDNSLEFWHFLPPPC